MNPLQRFTQLGRRTLAVLAMIVGVAIWALALAIESVLGRFEWHAPAWAQSIGHGLRAVWRVVVAHKAAALKAGGAAALIALVVVGGKAWYDSRPRPIEVTFQVAPPSVTRYEATEAKPYPLVVHFSASAAPLNLVGKEVTAGVSIRPSIAGRWFWDDDRTLRFEPKGDWPVGEQFAVSLDREKFAAPHSRSASR